MAFLRILRFLLLFVLVSVKGNCPAIESPLHGALDISDPLLPVDATAEVICEPGYNTTGPNPITCMTGDAWSALVPHCDSHIKIDLEALREKSKDGAEDQDWWIDFGRYDVGKTGLIIAALIILIVFALVCVIGAYTCGMFLINRRKKIEYRKAHPFEAEEAEKYGEEPWKDEPDLPKSQTDYSNSSFLDDDGETVPISFQMRKGQGWKMNVN